MAEDLIEPSEDIADPGELVIQYLDRYRDTVWAKVEGLPEADLRRAVLPSGWSMLELLHHLRYAERRWFQWCFLASVEDMPWGDRDPSTGRWAIPDGMDADTVRTEYWQEIELGRQLVADHRLDEVGQRVRDEGHPRPTLAWILFHLLQEYARHAGHLDVVRELIEGDAATS